MNTRTLTLSAVLIASLFAARAAGAQQNATDVPASSQITGSTPKANHKGGIDDIEAIGSRKIGTTGLGNWYSLRKEISMGKSYAGAIESSVKLLADPVVNEYVNRIGQNLVRNSDAKVPFTIKIIESEEVNAFALPGGFFYVNTGLVLAADSEAELAGVMSHEIAHVAARHATRQMTRADLFNLASIPLIFVGPGVGQVVRGLAGLAIPLSMSKFSRGFEREADYLGIEYMYKAGYDPEAFISFFEKVTAKDKTKPGTLSKAFATHPPTSDRILRTQTEIDRLLPVREQYIVTTSEFDNVKSRLMAIEQRHTITDEYRPRLRNAPASKGSNNGEDVTSADDDRPTLRKREQYLPAVPRVADSE